MEIEQDPLPLPPSNNSLENGVTTPKPKHTTMNDTNGPSCVVFDDSVSPNQNLRKSPQNHLKKQTRRRLLTSRPYQEKVMDMAEARREIVTALKIHRASMKQAIEEQQLLLPQQQLESLSLQTSNVTGFDQDRRIQSRRNPRIYTSCTTEISSQMVDFSASSSYSPPPPNSYPNTSHVITSPSANLPPKEETPNFTLPNQTLGLNLNLHHFSNLEATPFPNNNNNDNTNSSLCSHSSPTPSSPPLVTNDQDVPSIGTSHSQGEGVSSVVDKESNATINSTTVFHTAMDDEGMEEIRLLGEKHQMELDDTLSMINSVRWFNCLKNMEHVTWCNTS